MAAPPPVDSSSRLMLRPERGEKREREREREREAKVDFIVVDSFVIPS